jgi:formamidopyrimidine-DNA glycosylase
VLSSRPVPELPEVETVRRSLERRLVGRRVERVWARRIRLREGIEPRDWRVRIAGGRLLAVERRAKYLLLRFDVAVGLFHLGMSGRLMLAPTGRARAPHTHLVLEFEGGVELRFVDPRRFGVAVVLAPDGVSSHPPLARLGMEPLDGAAGPLLRARAARSRVAIRNLLLDQSVLAGLGNIYANEALFRAGIHPLRAANTIAARRIERLGVAVREVLLEALAAGGTTLADGGFADADGRDGYFAVALSVYGRTDQPCVRCGRPIVRRPAAGRSVFFCSRCQR